MAICDNINDTGGGNGEIGEVNNNGSTPVLIGDSWGVGMAKHFKGISQAIGGSGTVSPKGESAVDQITKYLKGGSDPKFILVHTGVNYGENNIKNNGYEKVIKACNGKPVYFMQQQKNCWTRACKNGDLHSEKLIKKLNDHIKSVCSKYTNASFIDINANGFNTADNNYAAFGSCPDCNGSSDGKGLHPTSTGYKGLLGAALKALGQTSYLK